MAPAQSISLFELAKLFFSFGLSSFTDRVDHQEAIRKELVDRRKIVSSHSFSYIDEFCRLIPGIRMQKLAIHLGWYLHGVAGGLAAGIAYILPGVFLILALSICYVSVSDLWWGQGIRVGLTPCAIAILIDAIRKPEVPKRRAMPFFAIATLSFLMLWLTPVPFLIVLVIGIAFGIVLLKPRAFEEVFPSPEEPSSAELVVDATNPDEPGTYEDVQSTAAFLESTLSGTDQTVFTLLLFVFWITPLVVLSLALESSHSLITLGWMFLKCILISFGDAQGVLAYVVEQAVLIHGWLDTKQLADAIAIAAAIPGPFLLIFQFMGFLSAYTFSYSGELAFLNPYLAGTVGAFLGFWVTALPAFLWVFTLAPHSLQIRFNPLYNSVSSGIRATLFGALVSLLFWLTLRSLFEFSTEFTYGFLRLELPLVESLHFTSAVLTLVAIYVKLYLRQSNLAVVYSCVPIGFLLTSLEIIPVAG